ncbi:hypothetical protein C5167_042673 [Papaver somniferum]|uniref:Uncharacterized protein n=1 Tax=Papaver somniferum TaxID=3469 RepID=A0A4Y7L7E6_PAPSO|nr:uncharacterized protein LOC113315485 [Papaver somniferum]RZC80095.1 hypothetical protein C5167_042673 [Papaver somniferum]
MELFTATKDLKFLDAHQIIGEAVKIPAKSSSSPLFLITTITLILPLSVIQLLCKISFSDFMLALYPESINEFFYILSLFLLSLLSTSAIVFTVASLYASKSVSLISTLFAIPRVFEHLLITFFYALLLEAATYYLVIFIPKCVLDFENKFEEGALWWDYVIAIAVVCLGFLVHFYVMALWHLASVISVLEPNLYGLSAMKKSKELLQGRTKNALELVNIYFAATWFIGKGFGFAMQLPEHCMMVKILLGLLILFMLVAVNLTGFLVQSVFYFALKSHHDQITDKKVLHDHLCGYVNSPSTDGGVEVQSLVKGQEKVGYQAVALDATTDV